jgi:hypothetical protein
LGLVLAAPKGAGQLLGAALRNWRAGIWLALSGNGDNQFGLRSIA